MGLLAKPDNKEAKIEEFITHSVWRRYPDGRIFHVKSWTTQKGKTYTPPKPKQKRTMTYEVEEVMEL